MSVRLRRAQIWIPPIRTEKTFHTPSPSKDDPSYCALNTPQLRRDLQTTRAEPLITRARARNRLQDVTDA